MNFDHSFLEESIALTIIFQRRITQSLISHPALHTKPKCLTDTLFSFLKKIQGTLRIQPGLQFIHDALMEIYEVEDIAKHEIKKEC